jgi:class 3 adenylate cyclase
VRNALLRLISIADIADDDDDARLRRRIGVVAGYITIFAPLSLPLQVTKPAAGLVLALSLTSFTIVNLVVLARTKRFERYVVLLLSAGVVFVPAATFLGGGIDGAGRGVGFAFLIPAYAIMALGPRAASRWFLVFVGVVVAVIVEDPLAREFAGSVPYPAQLMGAAIDALVPMTIVFLLLRYIDVQRRAAEARVDELLTNAIPRPIATRLKHGEKRIADSYPETTVVFTDLAGFTPWTARTDAARVVALLDDLFSRFDALCAARGLEKIKTIGDSYMAVSGAPTARGDHAQAGVEFAIATLEAADEWRKANDVDLQIRVGVASGRVVAGVIGEQRALFDVWGEPVNMAARMQSSGVAGAVQVAPSTYALLTDKTGFSERDVEVKGLGLTKAYLRR